MPPASPTSVPRSDCRIGSACPHHRARVEQPRAVDLAREGRDIVAARLQHDRLRRAFAHQLALGHDRDAGAELQRLLEVVCDEQDRLVQCPLQSQQLVLHLGADQRIERAEGLVHNQDVGIGGERAGKADTLAHAAGQLMREVVAPAAEADGCEHLLGAAAALGRSDAAQLQAELDILEDALVREQREVLEDHRDARAAHPRAAPPRRAGRCRAHQAGSCRRSVRSAG